MKGIALLGAGRMAQVHAAAINAAGARVAAIYDPVASAVEALAVRTGAQTAKTAAVAMRVADVDAIVIATSSDTHVELIVEAVKTGKPVLCEKPLAPSLAEARRCIEQIGEEAAKRVFLGFNRRYDRGHASVREAVKAGKIGRLEQLTITSRDPYPPPLEYIPRSGGLFRDMMINDFDMARSILGQDPVSLTAHGSSIVDPEIGRLGDIDTASVTLLTADGTIVTCIGNDYSFDEVFARQVQGLGRAGDMLIGISTSGNSRNVIRAVEEARAAGMKVVCLLGRDGGALRDLCDVAIVVPSQVTARIQESHILIGHTLCGMVEQQLGLV